MRWNFRHTPKVPRARQSPLLEGSFPGPPPEPKSGKKRFPPRISLWWVDLVNLDPNAAPIAFGIAPAC